jgi:hypothetical protein
MFGLAAIEVLSYGNPVERSDLRTKVFAARFCRSLLLATAVLATLECMTNAKIGFVTR